MSHRIEISSLESAFQNRLSTFRVKNLDHKDINAFFEDAFTYFVPMVESVLDIHYLIKLSVCFHGIFEKKVITCEGPESSVFHPLYLHSNMEIIDFETNLKDFYDEYVVKYIKNRISEIQLRGSGFALSEIVDMEVSTSSYDPYNGASYIELPKKLSARKSIINVKNNDEMCFKYAILSALFPFANNAHRVSNYKRYEKELNFNGINFPVRLKDIKKFEEINPTISINLYMWNEDNEKVRPLRLTKNVKQKHIHLLLLTQQIDGSDTPKTHYCWIKNLSGQISKNTRKKIFCDRCLNHFSSIFKLEEHRFACINQNDYQIVMTKLNSRTTTNKYLWNS